MPRPLRRRISYRVCTAFVVLTAMFTGLPAATDDREVQVNANDLGSTFSPAIEALDNGGFAVVWSTTGLPIMGRLLDAQGLPVGDDFIVDTATSGPRKVPEIERLSDGRLVVAWSNRSTPAFRFLSADGIPIGDQFDVVDLGSLDRLTVAPATDGGFLLAWDCITCGGDAWDSYSQRFDSLGQAVSAPTRVHTSTTGSQIRPHAVSLENDGFLVVWRDVQEAGNTLRMRRLHTSGDSLGGEFELDTMISSFFNFAIAGEGDRLVAVLSNHSEAQDAISLFRFDTLGNRIGQEFVAAAGQPHELVVERANMNALGQIDVIARKITVAGPNKYDRDVVSIQMDFDDGILDANFQVNSLHHGQQYLADSVRTQDSFLVVWSNSLSDDPGYNIQGRSSFETLFVDGFEAGNLLWWHRATSQDP